MKSVQYKLMHKKWTQLRPQLQKAEEWKRQYKITSLQTEEINALLSKRITVSDKMQVLSQSLPNGVWFNNLNFKQKEFYLDGSVVSLNKKQMSLLNLFLSSLNNDKRFSKDFSRLELGRMRMRTFWGYSIMDFVLEGNLK